MEGVENAAPAVKSGYSHSELADAGMAFHRVNVSTVTDSSRANVRNRNAIREAAQGAGWCWVSWARTINHDWWL